jgi:phosphosulfolactate synthase (CoM biosynthesis protein A)
MADVPHERSLVKRLEGKPFALLGINSDKDREAIQNIIVKEAITWRSWWDGGSNEGPIATKWNVRGWPTLYLLDGKGVIRFKGDYLRSSTIRQDKAGTRLQIRYLDDAVDELLKEGEEKK